MVRLLVLASKPAGLSPSQRFRLEQWAPRLERDHGIKLDFSAFESPRLARLLPMRGHVAEKAILVLFHFFRRADVLRRIAKYDAVVVHREAALIGPAIYERLVALCGTPIIFDFDDAIWLQQPGSGFTSKLHFFAKTGTICRIATAVSAGNAYLAEFASGFNGSVFEIPTSIELDDYKLTAEPLQDSRFIVCWTGSTSTLSHFETARPALVELARQIPLTVKVICNRPPERDIEGAEMVFVRWSAEAEVREVAKCHVGIMPLPDDDFARGKCGLKALQFMAAGRPVVASPVGVNCEIIKPGINGYLADSPAEFAARLRELSRSETLRDRLGKAGRNTVEASYSAEAVSAQFARVVRYATASSPQRQ